MCQLGKQQQELLRLLVMTQDDDYFRNLTIFNCSVFKEKEDNKDIAFTYEELFYAYFMPLLFAIGLLGNIVSLCVFLSKSMRNLSASKYLAALSTSDLIVLIFYVLTEWLARGVPVLYQDTRIDFLNFEFMCRAVRYVSYVSRFLSAWLLVVFTVERYIGVCHPLYRRHIGSSSSTMKIVFGLVILSMLVNIFKPILSTVEIVRDHGYICTTNPNQRQLTFILDAIYAVSITILPFIIITFTNILIIRQLVKRNRQRSVVRIVTEESVLRLEFTSILLVISFCFVALNLPYVGIWCKLFLASNFEENGDIEDRHQFEYYRGVLLITRAVFCVNYCINFFLYSITGAYFRRQLKALFHYRSTIVEQKSYVTNYRVRASVQVNFDVQSRKLLNNSQEKTTSSSKFETRM